MTALNNIYEIIGCDIKSIDDLAREGHEINPQNQWRRQRHVEKLSNIEDQLLDEETRAFMQEARIPQQLGYFLAYLYHIKRMKQKDIHNLIYEQTGQVLHTWYLFKSLDIPTRNLSEALLLSNYPDINFKTYEQRPPLSDREIHVLETRYRMGTNKAAANELGISQLTIRHHLSSIYRKLDVLCFTEAIVQAMERGLIPELQLHQQHTSALTKREIEVLETRIEMKTNKATAEIIGISNKVVNQYFKIMFQRLKVHTFEEAVEEARRRGYII